jgi:hypothetical protein
LIDIYMFTNEPYEWHTFCHVLFCFLLHWTHTRALTPNRLRALNVCNMEIFVHRSRIYSHTNDKNLTICRNGGFNNSIESVTTIPSVQITLRVISMRRDVCYHLVVLINSEIYICVCGKCNSVGILYTLPRP